MHTGKSVWWEKESILITRKPFTISMYETNTRICRNWCSSGIHIICICSLRSTCFQNKCIWISICSSIYHWTLTPDDIIQLFPLFVVSPTNYMHKSTILTEKSQKRYDQDLKVSVLLGIDYAYVQMSIKLKLIKKMKKKIKTSPLQHHDKLRVMLSSSSPWLDVTSDCLRQVKTYHIRAVWHMNSLFNYVSSK